MDREKNMMQTEREVFGVTYDRYVLLQLHRFLARTLSLKNIVEMPSHGAKAAGSLYSIGFGLVSCNVTLINPEQDMLCKWQELGIEKHLDSHDNLNVYRTGLKPDSFDLAWNFVTWTELSYPDRYLKEMKRISKKYIMLVTCNNFQPGYPWHRFLHWLYDFPWTHGQVEYNHITKVKRLLRKAGMKVIEYGAIDTPGWPDPSGPRDVRLHRRYGSAGHNQYQQKPQWEVPILDYIKTGIYPDWMRLLGKWDMLFRKGVFKLPMSHLFYVIGEK